MPRPQNRVIPKRQILANTWNKAWTKQWLLANTPFSVPRTIVYSETWVNLQSWLRSSSCPAGKWFVIKPVSLSLSRGVRLVKREPGELMFRDANERLQDIVELSTDLQCDLPGSPANQKWLVEEYVWPPPEPLKSVQFDGDFNPLVRIIMRNGFHFGELHIPTKASRGRGTLKGGARRVAFNYKGELLQEYPKVKDDLPWNQRNYGTRIDVTGLVLPEFEALVNDMAEYIAKPLAGQNALFAIDGCYRKTDEGPKFVIIEIEHAPNVRHLATYRELRRPSEE